MKNTAVDKDETIAGECPVCGGPRARKYRPFCSARCQARDLNRWFSEAYSIPGPPADLPTEQKDDAED